MSLLTDFQVKQDEINNANKTAYKILNSVKNPITTNLLYRMDTYERFSNRVLDTGIAQSSITSRYTIFMTIYPYTWSNYKGIMGMHTSAGIVGFQYEDGTIRWCHNVNQTGYLNVAPYIGTTYKKYNVVIQFDGSGIDFWCNGQKVVTDFTMNTLTANGNIILGRSFNANNRYFDGKLGYVYIYRSAMSDADIQKMNKSITDIQKYEGVI